jgi:hypothetical protein
MELDAYSIQGVHGNSFGWWNLMKTALSRILEFFVGHDRPEGNNPAYRDYCICGAPKPEEARGRKREPSFKAQSHPAKASAVSSGGWLPATIASTISGARTASRANRLT